MKFCNLTTLVYGAWHSIISPSTEEKNSMVDSWHYCPKTRQSLVARKERYENNTNYLAFEMYPYYHIGYYSCSNRTYEYMKYIPGDCHFFSVKSSLRMIDKNIYHQIEEDIPSPQGSADDRVDILHLQTLQTHHQNIVYFKASLHNKLPSANDDNQHTPRTLSQELEPVNLSKHRNRFVYIGDSLSGQQYISSMCLIEQFGYEQTLQTMYILEFFLRPDIPCAPSCISNPGISHKLPLLSNYCLGCLKGKYRPFEEYSQHPRFWYNRIPNDTLAVTLDSGVWYELFRDVIDSVTSYEETIILIKPFLETLIDKRNVTVFWLGLVPTLNDKEHNFRIKDNIAKKHLEPIGVLFIDEMALLYERLNRDPHWSADGLHWW